MPTPALELLQVTGGGEGQGQGREAAAAAALRLHDQERGRPPRGRLPVAQVRPEGRQEQPIPQVRTSLPTHTYIHTCTASSIYSYPTAHCTARTSLPYPCLHELMVQPRVV